jgi:type I restriction enzyme R subunit
LHSVSEHERRLVRNTYIFFDCWDAAKKEGRPTFEYGIQRGIKDGYLTKYRIYHAESVLTFEGAEWEDEEIKPGAWGRDVESEDRLRTILQEYYAADAERARVRPRKTIVFAVSEKQASILVRLFNKLLSDEDCLRIAGQINRSPSEVRHSFAKKITCYTNNGNPKPIIDEFRYDPLPLVAVSVDMLDTGYDQKDLENLIMLRPTKSPIKYAQMRGRGSRLCPKIGKEEFIIYDFVGNSKRFNDPGERYDKPKLVGVTPGSRLAETGEIEEGDVPQPETGTTYPEEGHREFITISDGSLDDEIRSREISWSARKGWQWIARPTARSGKEGGRAQTHRSGGGKDLSWRGTGQRGMGGARSPSQLAPALLQRRDTAPGLRAAHRLTHRFHPCSPGA